MKQYDFQKLITDLIAKLEKEDTAKLQKASIEYLKPDTAKIADAKEVVESPTNEDWGVDWSSDHKESKKFRKRTYHSMNFDLGTNNYIGNEGFLTRTTAYTRLNRGARGMWASIRYSAPVWQISFMWSGRWVQAGITSSLKMHKPNSAKTIPV